MNWAVVPQTDRQREIIINDITSSTGLPVERCQALVSKRWCAYHRLDVVRERSRGGTQRNLGTVFSNS
jgi:hypothetical protein